MDNNIRNALPKQFSDVIDNIDFEVIQIRMRTGQPVIFEGLSGREKHGQIVNYSDIKYTVEMVCMHSVYAYANEIGQGFITMNGGHRVGISGETVIENGKIKTFKYISSINIRVSHEIKGCAEKFAHRILKNKSPGNVLFVSPPGKGKTTLLRDLIRIVSNSGYNISLIDERMEIAASKRGYVSNDIGLRTDVISGCKKNEGMMLAIRAMSPDIIAVDEIGDRDDKEAINEAVKCGISLFATAHGSNESDTLNRINLNGIFDFIILWKEQQNWICISK